MTKSSYKSLQLQAQQTLELLNDVVKDRFDAILLQKSDFDPMRYDIVFKLSAPEELHDSFWSIGKDIIHYF